MKYILHLTLALFFFLVTLSASFAQGDAPTMLQGQMQSAKAVGGTVKVPGSQVTKLSASSALLETGNFNLLINPSFEHATGSAGWSTFVTGTAVATYGTASTPTGEFGLKQATWSCAGGASGGTCTFFQDVTTSKIIGGYVSAYVSTSNTAATVFTARSNGSTSKQVTAQTTSEFPYAIPTYLGSSSTGVGIVVTVPASTTYNGTLDNAFVGVKDVVKNETICDKPSCETEFVAHVTAAGSISMENLDWLSSCNSASHKTCYFTSGVFTVAPVCTTNISQNESRNFSNSLTTITSTYFNALAGYGNWAETAYPFYVRCTKTGVDYTNAIAARNGYATYTSNAIARSAGQIITTSSATCPAGTLTADGSNVSRATYPQLYNAYCSTGSCIHGPGDGSTTFGLPDLRYAFIRGAASQISVTGTGTPASNNATFTAHGINRTGMRVRLTSGTLTGLSASTDYYAIVVDANTLAFATTYANAIAGTKITLSGTNSGVIAQWEDPDITSRVGVVSGASGANVGSRQADAIQNMTGAAGTIMGSFTASGVFSASGAVGSVYGGGGGTGQTLNFTASNQVRTGNDNRPTNVYAKYCIQVEDTNIIGSFENIEKCTDSWECSDIASVSVSSAGVVTGDDLDFINGNATITTTSEYNFTFNTGKYTVAPKCWGEIAGTGQVTHQIPSANLSSTGLRLTTYNTNTGGQTTSAFTLFCQKQGVDLIGKTAKAVASDQNVRTMGVTKAALTSAFISTTGVKSQDDSNMFSGNCVTSSANIFTCPFTSNLWTTAPKCWGITTGGTGWQIEMDAVTTSSLVMRTANNAGTAVFASFNVFCHGQTL